MVWIPELIPVFILKFAALLPGISSAALSAHVHSEAGIDCGLAGDFDGAEACWMALNWLDWHGVDQIVICGVQRIDAPLSGYLVDAQGVFDLEGRSYTLFRIGIRDGEEGEDQAGEEFVLLAAGFTEYGEVCWHPQRIHPRDPNAAPPLEFEFMTGEDEFLAIPSRFPL